MKRAIALLFAALLLIAFAPNAQADIIRLDYAADAVDPAETFDADCLGDTRAEDCDARAALIEGDLVLVLAELQNDTDPATLALFQDALQLKSPVVRAMATQYVAASGDQPQDFLSQVKTFFFGPDAPLGAGAAKVLEGSPDSKEQDLAHLYAEARDSAQYAPQDPPPDGQDSNLLKACTKDARLDLMTSFTDDEQFQPATRLLMYDRFVRDSSMPTDDYPVTAFGRTDASVEDVSTFFDAKFGKSYGPYADAESHIQELSMELLTLQQAAASGDKAAIAKLEAAGQELADTEKIVTLGSVLQLTSIHAENDLLWLDGSIDDVTVSPVRAVTVGADPTLGQTVIRYINAPLGSGTTSPGSGNAGESATAGGASSGTGLGEGGAAERASKSSDGGCGCAVPHGSRPSAVLSVLGLLALARRRRRSLQPARRLRSTAIGGNAPG